jgi:hypothetical protein
MSRFLFGALAMGAVFALTSFAVREIRSPTAKDGPAWRVSDYRLDRAFRFRLPLNGGPISSQIPIGGGWIITQVHGNVTIGINGAEEFFNSAGGDPTIVELNPPIIARPGDVITITYNGTPVVAGYTTYSGET